MSSAMLRCGSRFLAVVSLAVGVIGCDSPAPDLREWTVEDHKHRTERKTRRAMDRVRNHSRPQKIDQVASVTWSAQCASCHGKKGKGDGPTSIMVQAKDLTNRTWQATVTDAQLATSIRKGKGKMPAFDLPESTIQSMVHYVRQLRNKTQEERTEARRERRASRRRARGATGSPSQTLPVAAAPASQRLPAPASQRLPAATP